MTYKDYHSVLHCSSASRALSFDRCITAGRRVLFVSFFLSINCVLGSVLLHDQLSN